jgi:hypothetical protein
MDRNTFPDEPVDYFGQAPGVYLEKNFRLPRRKEFFTGVPAFLGQATILNPKRAATNNMRQTAHDCACTRLIARTAQEQPGTLIMLSLWSHFSIHVAKPTQDLYLAHAVRGFFQNGGRRCYVVALANWGPSALQKGLDSISKLNTVDLVCVPGLASPDLVTNRKVALGMQQMVVNHCESMGDRFAILDSRRSDSRTDVADQWSEIDGVNGAIYYPWIKVPGLEKDEVVTVPPCGHVAGVYARTDNERGWHKAPANAVLEGVVGLEYELNNADYGELNNKRVNCLRSFPGRGIRVFGARTLSGHDDWIYVNVRRLFLTAVRWMQWNMLDVVFEPHDARLWARIERELHAYFTGLYRKGALKGATPQEAFYIKCDAETNPREVYEAGRVVVEVGLAPANPFEFVIVRLICGESGVSISGPTRPEQIL